MSAETARELHDDGEIRGDDLPPATLTNEQVVHIFVEVLHGRGRHGHFLRAFAEAIARADDQNLLLIRAAACAVVTKYRLDKYLDTLNGGKAITF